MKRKGKSRRISILLNNSKQEENTIEYNFLNTLKIKDINTESKGEISFKKK